MVEVDGSLYRRNWVDLRVAEPLSPDTTGSEVPASEGSGFQAPSEQAECKGTCMPSPAKQGAAKKRANLLVKQQRRPQGGYGLRGLVCGLLLGRKSGSDHPQLGVRYNINY